MNEGTPIEGAVVLLTGAGGGIGQALVAALRKAGAAEIIAADRGGCAGLAGLSGVTPLALDVTQGPAMERAMSGLADRVDILINCAGTNGNSRLFAPGFVETARREIEVNYFGLLHMVAAVAPAMRRRGSGTIVNLLSFLGHVNLPLMASYCASKAAAHSITQALRAELQPSGVRVLGVYPAVVDTPMSRDVAEPKQSPRELAQEVVEAIRRGEEDLYPGTAEHAYRNFVAHPKQFERQMAMRLHDATASVATH